MTRLALLPPPLVRSVPDRRLAAQLITRPAAAPVEVVAAMGAVQAQDYRAALWAVGLRTHAMNAGNVEGEIASGAIVRTHVFRGTLQLVARDDVRWMLGLVARYVIRLMAKACARLGLDEVTMRRAEAVLEAETEGMQRTRAELVAALGRAGIAASGQRGIYMILRAELDGVICNGARPGTFAAFAARVPAAPHRAREEALGELAHRYLQSRGPATVRDFQWWSGLPAAEAREGIASIEDELVREDRDGTVYWSTRAARTSHAAASAVLLPTLDEYLIGYQDRRDVLSPERAISTGNGLLAPCVVVDGRVVGTWRRTVRRAAVAIELTRFGRWDGATRARVDEAAARYAAFLGLPREPLLPPRGGKTGRIEAR